MPQFQAGMAKMDMTPDLGRVSVSLNGYGDRRKAPAMGVLDPVYARALVVKDGRGRLAAIVGTDLCYVNTELREMVLDRLETSGFARDAVLIAATHTHSSFTGYDRAFIAKAIMGSFEPEILTDTADAIAQAVLDANANLRPVIMSSATRDVDGLNRNRQDPGFSHGLGKSTKPEGEGTFPTNNRMTVISFVDEEQKTVGAVLYWSAHPTVLSPKNKFLSADYPGVVDARLEEEMGEGSVALFLNGTLGDLAPIPDWEEAVATEVKMMGEYGAQVAEAAIDVLHDGRPVDRPDVVFTSHVETIETIRLRPLWRVKLPSFLRDALFANPKTSFQALRLGGHTFLAVPGEPTTATGRALASLCDGDCLVVGPANGYLGYVVTPDEYERDTYEASSCF
ncbi:MAG: neutral/alkaline non-lysosomal ceramidase N-terminal domain-containing protein [Deltaproteobacteria bacterium]|nr:neutral/alkaline non-lysosomal ceramidase N-terminal domain-containing protein [Deltaproteobacteria bacterium]